MHIYKNPATGLYRIVYSYHSRIVKGLGLEHIYEIPMRVNVTPTEKEYDKDGIVALLSLEETKIESALKDLRELKSKL